MNIEIRIEPKHLIRWRYLYPRANFSAKETDYYLNLEKGFEGERTFDKWLKKILSKNWIFLSDLLFEYNNSEFQIDTLIIAPHTIYLFEIKNYHGNYYIEDGKWFNTKTEEDIKNPLHQLERSETLLRRTLKSLGITYSIESHLVFVNPEFHLYEAPRHLPIIFPAQINQFLKKLNSTSSLRVNSNHEKIAERLLSNQLKQSKYNNIPKYTFDQLKKGILCAVCNSFQEQLNKTTVICIKCREKEKINSAVLRSVEEFKLLFPDKKITTPAIHEWCQCIKSKKAIRRILLTNYEVMKLGASTYYI